MHVPNVCDSVFFPAASVFCSVSVPCVHFDRFPFYFGLTRKTQKTTRKKLQNIIMVGYILHCHGAFLRFLLCDFVSIGFVWKRDSGRVECWTILARTTQHIYTVTLYPIRDSMAGSDYRLHTTHNY